VAEVELRVNGTSRWLELDPRVGLLDALRDHLRLTGTTKGCDQGACTVLVDGERILACLALAVPYGGRAITTVEGIGGPGRLHPLQEAFVRFDGFQCGFCTSGRICSAVGMPAEHRAGVPSAVTPHLAAPATPCPRPRSGSGRAATCVAAAPTTASSTRSGRSPAPGPATVPERRDQRRTDEARGRGRHHRRGRRRDRRRAPRHRRQDPGPPRDAGPAAATPIAS
jgi:xanthine dehydrogenase YagT iron-sulfur-binding subunit